MDDARFKENFRLDRRAFQKVCEKVRGMEKMDSNMRRCIPLEKRVAIALFSLGSTAEYRTVSSLFGVGRSTVGEIVSNFCHAVCDNLADCINTYPPNQREIKRIIPQCFGAIDGCHIEVQPRKEDAVDYHNYKGWEMFTGSTQKRQHYNKTKFLPCGCKTQPNQPNHTKRVGENDQTAAAIRNAIAMSF
ncbi:uncharacterized protein LOC118756417, partial [Rhagoletis pomonella]|uniref:uncharacterized protein LOC118756417 n=1 Tax=Rhagoletis pomonella TaxID=28610 RepID=UPI001782D815